MILDSHAGKAFARTGGIPAPSLTARARNGPITGARPLPPELGQASDPLHMGADLLSQITIRNIREWNFSFLRSSPRLRFK